MGGLQLQIEARFRRRPDFGESVEGVNARILSELSKIDGLWAIGDSVLHTQLNRGSGESAAVDISICLRGDMKGTVSYASRVCGSALDRRSMTIFSFFK